LGTDPRDECRYGKLKRKLPVPPSTSESLEPLELAVARPAISLSVKNEASLAHRDGAADLYGDGDGLRGRLTALGSVTVTIPGRRKVPKC
jgi:hypothetical protein